MRRSPRAIAVVSVALLISTMQLLGAGPVRASHNLLDADTATLEGSVGHWVPWFSSTVARSTAEAHSGVASLKVDVTALHGWGAQLNNAPGFAASPGPMYLSFWGKLGSGSGLGATMHVDWHGISGSVFRTDTVKLPTLTGTWTQATNAVIAPPGTTSVTVEFTHPTGGPGDVIYLDDIVVSGTVNAVEYTTATLESSTGHWVPWFSTSLSLAGPPVNGGNFGLRIDVTAPFGWGVQLDNSPGFSAPPARRPSPSGAARGSARSGPRCRWTGGQLTAPCSPPTR